MGKIQSQDLGSGINILDLTFENLESDFGLTLLKFFDADLGSFQPWIRNPGWEKIGNGIFISAPQHWL
jgi:hypothetical protein